MPHAFDPTRRPQVALAPGSLRALRNALLADLGPEAAGYLQEAGYETGVGHADAMRQWLRDRGEEAPETLALDAFQARVGEFFRELGWGEVSLDLSREGVTVVETHKWAEWVPRLEDEPPSCHFSTGMFAGFFGSLAEHPLAVMEVDAEGEQGRCRFLLGNADVLGEVYAAVEAGGEWREMAGAASA